MSDNTAGQGPKQRSVRPTAFEVLDARKTKANCSMEQWLGFLDTAALSAGFKRRIAADTGPECWQDYYDDGYTPREALAEDLHHAA